MCKKEQETMKHLRKCGEMGRETRSAHLLDDKGSGIEWMIKIVKR